MNTQCTCEDWALEQFGFQALCKACEEEYAAIGLRSAAVEEAEEEIPW